MLLGAFKRKEVVDDFATALLYEGVVTKYGNRALTLLVHNDKDIDFVL